jgi:hypothetical protein
MEPKMDRPQTVTWLLVIVLTFTGGRLLSGLSALQHWSRLNQLPLSISPLYIVLSGFAWAVVGVRLAWAVAQRRAGALGMLRAASFAFALFYWLERGLLQVNESSAVNQPFALALTIALLTTIYWLARNPATLAFFGDHHE